MKRMYWLALLLAVALGLGAGTAHAQGPSDDRTCFGRNNDTVESGQQVRNLLVIGCNATVRAGATVQGDATVIGANLVVEKGARVSKDVAVFGGNVSIGGEVGENVAIVGGNVSLLDGAVVNGNVRLAGGQLQRAEGAVVRGSVSETASPTFPFGRSIPTPVNPPSFMRPFRWASDFTGDLLGVVALAALGVLVAALAPGALGRVAGAAQSAPPLSAGVGCLSLLALPVVLIALSITLIGIPIAVLLGLVAIAAWYFGWIAIGYLVGTRLLHSLRTGATVPVLATLFGVVVLAVVEKVPCIGWLVTVAVGILGLGAVLLTRFGTQAYPPEHGALPEPPEPQAPLAPLAPLPPLPPMPTVPPAPPAPGVEGEPPV